MTTAKSFTYQVEPVINGYVLRVTVPDNAAIEQEGTNHGAHAAVVCKDQAELLAAIESLLPSGSVQGGMRVWPMVKTYPRVLNDEEIGSLLGFDDDDDDGAA